VRTEKWRFPVRNRLLAMFSDVVVVVESRHRGGSMYTVGAAAERGTPVGAVPGSIRSATSEGTNRLLADGCFPVCAVADILVALSLRGAILPPTDPPSPGDPDRGDNGRGGPGDDLSPADRALFAVLSFDPASLDQLVRVTGLDLAALCGGLERLARAGVARDVGGWWERT
jgi:DNA processing protein